MKKTLLLLLLISTYLSAIVSIAPADIGEKEPGLSGEVMLALSSRRGNTLTDNTDTGGTVQYDTNRTVSFIKASYTYGEAKGIPNIDTNFIHIRNIIKLQDHFDWETFAQRKSDKFQSLSSRLLLGGVMRLNSTLAGIGGKGYLGLGGFYVQEIEINNPRNEFSRANIYLSYKLGASESFKFSLVAYYQPRFDNYEDYLLLSTAECDLKINESLALKISISYSIDSLPATGVQPSDFSQTTALKYKF